MNPIGNAYCDKCDARIVPMGASSEEPERERPPLKGLSLPTIPLEEKKRQPAGETPEEAEVEEEAAEGWLAQLRGSALEDKDEGAEAGEEEGTGDWLTRLRASAIEEAVEVEPVSAAGPIEPVEIPDWLRHLGPIGVGDEVAPSEAQPTAEPPLEIVVPEAAFEEATPAAPAPAPAEVPDWLREIAPAEEVAPEAAPPAFEAAFEEATPAAPAPAPAEIPDWLREIASAEEVAPEAAPPAFEAAFEEAAPAMPAPAPAEVPDWLREIALAEEVAPEAAPPAFEAAFEEAAPAMPAPAPAEIPDWLREIAPVEEVAPEAAPLAFEAAFEEAAPAMPAPAPAEVPDWLREIAPAGEAVREPLPSVPPLLEFPEEVGAAETPEWLVELKEAAPATVPAPSAFEGIVPPVKVAEAEGLAPAEIPAWLEAMRPRVEKAEAAVSEEPLETGGLLEGLRGVLASAPVAGMQARERARPAEVSEASLSRAQLLQSLLTRPAEAAQTEARKRGVSTAVRIERWFVVAVLLVSVAGALILDYFDYKVPVLTRPDASKAEVLYSFVEGVGVEDTVLIAFEYGPAEAGELDAVARPILRHLYDRGAAVVIASTQPMGLAAAEALQSRIASTEQYTLTYESAHYLPGGATGIVQLLANTDVRPTQIVVLAAQPAPLRWWIEQAYVWNKDVPLVAGVSAALEPVASPYLDDNAGQLDGAISGLSGAAAYEARRGSEGQAARQLNALAVGYVAVVVLLLVGIVIHAPAGLRRRGG